MKRILLALAFILALTGEAYADITTGLVGYWALDEGTGTSATDTGSGLNNGTLVNAPTWRTPGEVGAAALTLNGSNQYINIGNPVNMRPGTNGFSAAAWIKTSMAGRGMIFTSYNGSQDFIIFDIGKNAKGHIIFEYRDQVHINTVEYTSVDLADGNWHHVAAVYRSADGGYLFVDGAPATSTAQGVTTYNIATDSQAWEIGADDGANNPFSGSIDEIRWFHRSLSDADVLELYNYGFSSPSSPSVVHRRIQ